MTNSSAILCGSITNYGSKYLDYKFGYKLTLMNYYIYTAAINVPHNGTTLVYYKLDGLVTNTYYQYRLVANEQYDTNCYLSEVCYFELGADD